MAVRLAKVGAFTTLGITLIVSIAAFGSVWVILHYFVVILDRPPWVPVFIAIGVALITGMVPSARAAWHIRV